jgi:SPW repeat-containing protein
MEAKMAARKQASYQIISTRMHGMEDYAMGVLLLAAPYLFGFANHNPAQWVAMCIGGLILGSSLLTRYELGIYGLIPMPMHLMLDAGAAGFLIASPWLFGFSSTLPHVILGLVILASGAMTKTQPQNGPIYA